MTNYINNNSITANPLLNGFFEHCTDSASLTAAGFIGIMHSLVSLGTSGAATVSQQAFTVGQTDVAGEPRNFLRWLQSTAATAGNPELLSKVEDVRTFAGKRVTLQGYYRTNASFQIRARQMFGIGGSPSANVDIAADGATGFLPVTTDATGTALWKPFTISFTLPRLTGKTIGSTANTSYVGIRLLFPINATFQADVTALRLTPAGEANPSERRRPFFEEEQYLSRYYKQYLLTGTGTQTPFQHVIRMRGTPTHTASAGTANNPTVDGGHLNHTVNVAVTLTADARIAN
jgi:hypothetical protein